MEEEHDRIESGQAAEGSEVQGEEDRARVGTQVQDNHMGTAHSELVACLQGSMAKCPEDIQACSLGDMGMDVQQVEPKSMASRSLVLE